MELIILTPKELKELLAEQRSNCANAYINGVNNKNPTEWELIEMGTSKSLAPKIPTSVDMPNGVESIIEILGLEEPYPLSDVLQRLVDGSEYLLHEKSYDGDDYEEIGICVKRAKDIIKLLKNGSIT